jgi:hypothetical protein
MDASLHPTLVQTKMQLAFAAVHKVFGAGNVSKLLSTIPTNHRKEAIYGCVSTIRALEKQVK